MPKLPKLMRESHDEDVVPPKSSPPDNDPQSNSIAETKYDPMVDPMATAILSYLVNHMRTGLPPTFNSQIFRVIESYRCLAAETVQLRELFSQAMSKHQELEYQVQELNQTRIVQEENYRAEIKHLQHLVGQTGFGQTRAAFSRSDTSLAAHSVFNNAMVSKENIALAVTDSKPQTAPTSPSQKMRQLSMKVLKKPGVDEVQIGTPPKPSHLRPLVQTPSSVLSGQGSNSSSVSRLAVPRPDTRLSNDTYSTFSSYGDALPDELSESSEVTYLNADENFPHIRALAIAMKRQRGIRLEDAVNALATTFLGVEKTQNVTKTSSTNAISEVQDDGTQITCAEELTAHQRIGLWERRAASLSNNTKAPAKPDTSPTVSFQTPNRETSSRSFSFQEGDDRIEVAGGFKPQGSARTARSENQSLHSLSTTLSQSPFRNFSGVVDHASTSPHLRTTSRGQGQSGLPTRIPERTSSAFETAKAEREDSSSSLATVIHRSPVEMRAFNLSSEETSKPRTSKGDHLKEKKSK